MNEASFPIDPTTLTTQQLWREIAALKELMETRIGAVENGIQVAHADLVRVPTEVQKSVQNLRELQDEKFRGIGRQFEDEAKLRDEKFAGVETRFVTLNATIDKTSETSKTAVDAALQAAKELVAEKNISAAQSAAKQEASFSKQIDAQGILIQTTAKASDDKIADLKERFATVDMRITRVESKGEGTVEAKTTRQTSSRDIIALIGVVIAALVFLSGIGLFLMNLKH